MIFVSSWDDGHPLDRRIADLYIERGLQTTFYVPLKNCENRSVMTWMDIRAIDETGLEIGSHTADHRYLSQLTLEDMRQQILGGKNGLEQILGHAVTGFCYPGGRRPSGVMKLLRDSGITHARTVENLRTDLDFELYNIPTTLQFYPHDWTTLSSNVLKAPSHMQKKINLIYQRMKSGKSLAFLPALVESMVDQDVIFHLWGHSWEVEYLGAWKELACTLDVISRNQITSLSVGQLAAIV